VAADAALAAFLAAEAADLDDEGFAGGGGGGGGMWHARAAASPRTLETRQVREEQVHIYMSSYEQVQNAALGSAADGVSAADGAWAEQSECQCII
jgi:hypothetical protein